MKLKILYTICTIGLLYLGASFINTISNNLGNYAYAWWNVFNLF